MFNTAFIQQGNYIQAGKMELSPEDIRKDKGKIIPENFLVYIFFEDYCSVCSPYTTEIEDLCQFCKAEIGEATLNEWREVREILNAHTFPTLEDGHRMLPNVDPDLLQATLATQLQFNPNYYRIHTPEEIEAEEENKAAMEEHKRELRIGDVHSEENKFAAAGLAEGRQRKQSQKHINFPASPEEIDRTMLTQVKPHTTDDSFDENGRRIADDSTGNVQVPALVKANSIENKRKSDLPVSPIPLVSANAVDMMKEIERVDQSSSMYVRASTHKYD